jgi:formylglycine-generating enzyme required for sulfatase activity
MPHRKIGRRGLTSALLMAAAFCVQSAAQGQNPPATRLPTLIDQRVGLIFVRIPGGQYPELPPLPINPRQQIPGRRVTVGPLWIGLTDVTVSAYAKCAEAHACSADAQSRDEPKHRCTWKNGLPSHPINCVSWSEARQFCGWIKGRLPTATEWEYAATSGEPGKLYPWGDSLPDGKHADYCDRNCPKALGEDGKNLKKWQQLGWIDHAQDDGWAATSPTGFYPAGATPWGLLDMAGNVWQWTSSDAGQGKHEVRGGSWDNAPASLQINKRLAWPDGPDAGMGFRCVKDGIQPQTPALG